jgi:hypothetical protein
MPQRLVDLVRRSALDRVGYFCQGIDLHGLLVDQRREDHMHMVRHNHNNLDVQLGPLIMQAALQHDRPDSFGKNPTVIGTERQEVGLTVALQMWKLPSVKSFRHDSRGDSRPRLSSGTKLRSSYILVGVLLSG